MQYLQTELMFTRYRILICLFLLLVVSASKAFSQQGVVRGFVFEKENTDLMDFLKVEINRKFSEVTSKPANFEFIRTELQAFIEGIILEKTGRQPMVLPLVMEV